MTSMDCQLEEPATRGLFSQDPTGCPTPPPGPDHTFPAPDPERTADPTCVSSHQVGGELASVSTHEQPPPPHPGGPGPS